MAQRARLQQIKRTDINYPSFYEQFLDLEGDAGGYRKPVASLADLPQIGNRDGDISFVLEEDVIYRWKEDLQSWIPVLGKGYDVPSGTIKRYKDRYTATGGETTIATSFLYDVGMKTLDVYVQGLLQDEGVDYFEVAENTIEFAAPLEAGMQVTYITPYIVGETRNVTDLQKRLETIEHNHYKLMLNQYYSGKPVAAQGLAFDGFIDTSQIDYTRTSSNMEYNRIRQTMYVTENSISSAQDVFDTAAALSANSDVWLRDSEITLPRGALTPVFTDDFSTKNYLSDVTTAFHDAVKQQMTTTEEYSGGDHYYLGDFMGTTGNVDRLGEASYVHTTLYGLVVTPSYYYMLTPGYSVVKYSNYRANSNWGTYLYRYSGAYAQGDEIFHFSDYTTSMQLVAFVYNANKLYTVEHYHEGSGRYYQAVREATSGHSYNIGGWSNRGWPTGMPPTTGGTGATDQVLAIGATESELVIRVGDQFHFVDLATWSVSHTLDFEGADRIPSTYYVNAKQFTFDKRYLYNPARLTRTINGVLQTGYYMEVFDRETGELVNEVLVTQHNAGSILNTAVVFDWNYKRMILGQAGYYHYTPEGKSVSVYDAHSAYRAMLIFDSPSTKFFSVQSKPIYTNLPSVEYRLNVDAALNGGEIDYYIRFGKGAWTSFTPDVTHTWTNPGGAKEVSIELRAMMRSTIGAATSPVLTAWSLDVAAFNTSALYESINHVLTMDGVTGGKLTTDQTVPSNTAVDWSVQLDPADSEISVTENGTFSVVAGQATADSVMRARLRTNDPLFSPVIRDVRLDMHYTDAATLTSRVYEQLEDIRELTMWVTTETSSDYYAPSFSRDGGLTWVTAVRESVLRTQDGRTESKYHAVFTGSESTRHKLKVEFAIEGATEFVQYGIMVNPS